MKYMEQLDSIRAFAVIAVIFHHFWSDKYYLGPLGVHVFFVLSGYLITQILIEYRNSIDLGATIISQFKKFYIRRILRIFPIYYITIILVAIIDNPYAYKARESFYWNLLYVSNIKMFLDGNFERSIAHLWSLSVEEQFYLIWPLLLFYVSKQNYKYLFGICALLGPISRLVYSLIWPDNQIGDSYLLTVTCFDFFSMGALLALGKSQGWDDKFAKKSIIVFSIFLPLFIFTIIANRFNYISFLGGTLEALFFVWLVNSSAKGFRGFIGNIMSNKLLVYVGTVSYGVYLYHIFVGYVVKSVLHTGKGLTLFVVGTIVTIAVAAISKVIIENPISSLKNKNFI